jgi:non-canonical purine NTP pyrophosphatase (RdgB/HAM1 family)
MTMNKKEIFFVTGNTHKFEEAKKIIPFLLRKNLDLTEIQSMNPKEIIHAKLLEASKQIDGAIIVEDACVEIDAFRGFPGPFAKYFEKTLGLDRICSLVESTGELGITYRCTIGMRIDGKEVFFEGVTRGKVVRPRGKNGFGVDPIFMPEGKEQSFAEMTQEEKNKLSHRGKAFRKVEKYLKK